MFKIGLLNKLFLYIFITIIFFNQNVFAKSLPPGSGTGDVKANILILLDTSLSMNATAFGGASIYNPGDLILLNDGDVMVGQSRGAIVKFDYTSEDFDPSFVDPDGDGVGARLFQGSNSMPSCELEAGRQDSRIRAVGEMAKSSNVANTTPNGKEVIYSISESFGTVVAIDADGNCVEVIDVSELGRTSFGRFDRTYPKGLDIRTSGDDDHLIVTGFHKICLDQRRVGNRRNKRWRCFRWMEEPFFFTKNLSRNIQFLCTLTDDNSHINFRKSLQATESISMTDVGDGEKNKLFYVDRDEIYSFPIVLDSTPHVCPNSSSEPTHYTRNSGGNSYNPVARMSVDPQDDNVMYATSSSSHTLQKLSIGATITTSATVGVFNNSKSSANNINLVQPKGLHVSNDRVWVGNAKNSVQEFDISGGAMTWVDEMGTSAISRAEGAKRAIKAVVNDSSLTTGAYFGYGYWNAGTVPNGRGAAGKWRPFSEYSCHNMCPKAKRFHRCNDRCDYYRSWDATRGQHPMGQSKQCDDNSCLKVGVGPNTTTRIIDAVDKMRLRFGTDGTAFSQLAYEYFIDDDVGLINDTQPECQLNYVIVIGDGMWQHHDRTIRQIKDLRTETARMGVNAGTGVKTIFIAYGGGIKEKGDEQFKEAAKAGSCDDPDFGTDKQKDPNCRQRIIAENPKQLVTKLKSEIERIVASRLSFSAPSITANIQEGGDLFQGQFEHVTAGQWTGHLIRSEITPDGFVITTSPNNWDSAEKVQAQAVAGTRKIWTVLKNKDYKTDYNNWVPENSSEINFLFEVLGSTVTDYHNPSSACKAHIGETGNADDIKGLINFVRGEDYFIYGGNCSESDLIRPHVLGDIYHSQIVEVGAPGANVNFTSTNQEAYYRSKYGYESWAASLADRPRTLYVGANDGMFHAFDAETGEERWAFVPPFIAGRLPEMINDGLNGIAGSKRGGSNAIYAVDGSPVVHDMYISGLLPDGSFETGGVKSWHTILMIPYGRGGRGYSILDVTDPEKPLHVYSIYNNYIQNKVMIALHDGTIVNSNVKLVPDLDYTGGKLTIDNSEEALTAKYNINQARAVDASNQVEGEAEVFDERDKIVSCSSDANFYSSGTSACYTGRVYNFLYNMPEEFITNPETLVVNKIINGVETPLTVVSVTQEASLATITFAEDITINLGEGDNKSDTETDFFNMSIPNIGTADPTYDYSKLGETWATPRIFRLPVNRQGTIEEDKYVAVLPAGFGKTDGLGSAVYVIDLESMNEQTGGQYPGKLAAGGNGLINIVDINNKFTDVDNDLHEDIPNSILGDPVVITPDTFIGAKWRGALVYVNDFEGKISKINLTSDTTANDPSGTSINLFDHTTLFSLNANGENGRLSYFGMDATLGEDTKNLYLFGSTGDFGDISRKSKGMDNILYGIRDKDFPNFRMVNSGAAASLAEAMNAKKIDDEYELSPYCVNTADDGADQGDCPANKKDAWVFKLDKPQNKKNDKSLVGPQGNAQQTDNLYQKASASPTVFKGTVYYPVYQPTSGASCAVGNAYVCSADDECGINTSEGIVSAVRMVDENAGFDENTKCFYLQPGVLSKLVVFADKLFANITTDSEDQKDSLISLLANEGMISIEREGWRENY